MRAIGIDIGGSGVKAAQVGPGGRAEAIGVQRYDEPTRAHVREAIVAAMGGAMGEAIDGPRSGDDLRVGLCLPGVFDAKRAVVVQALNLPDLEGVGPGDLLPGELLERARGVRIVTDARAAAHDVWVRDRLGGRLAAISLGTGVGLSVLDDGRPLQVCGESPGHLGQIDVGRCGGRSATGPDGGADTLEAFIGLAALRARFGQRIEAGLDGIGMEEAAMVALVRALRVVHAIYRPDHVRLLGGVGVRLGPMIEQIREAVGRGLTRVARPAWTLAAGTSEHHAAMGAARLALESAPGSGGVGL